MWRAWRAKETSGFLLSLGLTLFTWDCSQTALTLRWISLIFVFAIPTALLVLALRYAAAHSVGDSLLFSALFLALYWAGYRGVLRFREARKPP